MMLSNTPSEIVVELRQTRVAYPKHSLILLEGKTDEALWVGYKATRCKLFSQQGKDKALAVLEVVNRTTLRGIAAIVDPDYWLIEQSDRLNTKNLLFDNTPDLELMLLMSPAFQKVLRHTLSVDELDDFSSSLRKEAVELAMEFGYFRLFDFKQREYNLSFNNVRFAEVIDTVTRNLNRALVAENLVKYSSLTPSQLLDEVEQLRQKYPREIELCKGKDVLSIIALLLGKDDRLSEKEKLQTKSNELSRTLRMAYEFTYFITTQLYGRIRTWENTNSPYRILNPEI